MAQTPRLSQTGEQQALNLVTGQAASTPNGNLKLVLLTATPGVNVSGASPMTGEVADANYARQVITFLAPTGNTPAATSLTTAVTFGPWAANQSGAITSFAVVDSAGTPVMWWFGDFTNPVTPNAGDSVQVVSGASGLMLEIN